MNRKGQLSIINIFTWGILVALGAVFTPMLAAFANVAAENANSSLGSTVASMIVPVFWIGVLITFFIYITPVRTQQY